LPGNTEPNLKIAWGSFHQNFLSNIPVFFQRTHLGEAVPLSYVLRDCRVEHRFPRRGILAAAVVQGVLLLIPWPNFPAAPRRNRAFDNTQLTWQGPIDDLPLLNMPREKKAAARAKAAEPEQPPPDEGADAFHPRQRIFTDPSHPTHPRQTLVNPAAPPDAPKILPEMPNIVHLASVAAPLKPRLEISEQALKELRPRAKKSVATTDAPSPDLPNLEQKPAEISLAATQNAPARPKLEINAGSAPRMAARTQAGEVAAAPDVAPAASNVPASPTGTLIALSASPAPPAPVVPVPEGNLAARVAISPEGKKPGAPGGVASSNSSGSGNTEAGSSSGTNSIGISISGGNPKPNAGVSGLSGASRFSLNKPQGYLTRPDPNAPAEEEPVRTGPPNFAALAPGAPPEQIFSRRRVYSMNVNMPNFNSATGSWIIHFSEMHLSGGAGNSGALAAPVPVHKVDPKYPATLMDARVEGEVVLYGVIRQNGTVDSIQLVRGVDSRLDANAMSAFGQWKFEPATREGQPVDLEAIIHIPFHAPPRE